MFNAAAVYVLSAFLSSWVFWDILPHQPGLQNGLACLPVMYSNESMIFFFAAFLPVLVAIPAVYVIYIAIQIWRRRLLPLTGRTRNVSIFIARLILVFIVMWLPSLILMFIASFWIQPWVRERERISLFHFFSLSCCAFSWVPYSLSCMVVCFY